MYFEKFPKTLYTLDNRESVQIVTNMLLRVKINEELVNNYSAYDEYDIVDGETPEILAYKFYGDSNLHWIILHTNELLDPRFDWILGTNELYEYSLAKYDNINGVHHYENSSGRITNGNISLTISTTSGFSAGSPIVSNQDTSVGFITSIPDSSTVVVTTTKGGFVTGSQIVLSSNSQVTSNITSTTIISGTPVTNFGYEQLQNETRRRIKLIKPIYIERITKQFDSLLAKING